jgi:glucokinase
MAKMLHLGANLTSKEVAELATQPGDAGEKARTVWRIMGEALGAALATLVNTFNFPLYLLSGGMLPAWDLFEPSMLRILEQRSATYRATKAEIRIAQATLGNEAGLFGAAYLPWVER